MCESDGQDEIVVIGIHHVHVRAHRLPEKREPLHGCMVRTRQRHEETPAVLEEFGEARTGAGVLGPGQRVAGMKWTPSGMCGPTASITARLTEPTSVSVAPRFRCGPISAATAPIAHGDGEDNEVRALDRFSCRLRHSVAKADLERHRPGFRRSRRSYDLAGEPHGGGSRGSWRRR